MTNKTRAAEVEALLSEFGPDPSFLATNGRSMINFPNGQIFYLENPAVKLWLKNSCLTHTGAIPSHAAISDAFDILRVRARTSRSFTPVAHRIAADNAGSIYLDLANTRNEIAHVTPHGWALTSMAPTVTFVSTRGQLPIPTPDPSPDATLDPLRPLLNCAREASQGNDATQASDASDASWNGITEWLTAALQPDQPCPVLILHGPPGSGKTTAARLLRSLIDPNLETLAVLPGRGAALERHAETHHVLAFDHVTRMSASATDALCRLSSGALGPSHPIILTVPRMDAADWQPRADLAARTIAVHLPAIQSPRRPKELQAEFESLRPKLLSALLTKVSIEPQGIQPRSDDAHALLLKASAQQDPLFQSIHNFMQTKEQWTGTATDLFNEICVTVSPRALSHRLRMLVPALSSAAITVEFHRIHKGIRQITITKVRQSGSLRPISNRPPEHTAPPAPNQAPHNSAPISEASSPATNLPLTSQPAR